MEPREAAVAELHANRAAIRVKDRLRGWETRTACNIHNMLVSEVHDDMEILNRKFAASGYRARGQSLLCHPPPVAQQELWQLGLDT